MLEDPMCHYKVIPLKKDGRLSIGPTRISNKEDIIIFSGAAFKAKEWYVKVVALARMDASFN